MSLFLIRDRLLVIVGVFPLLPPLPISPLPTSPHGLRVSFLESPTSCSADGLAGTVVRSAMSPAVASPVRMKLRFWDLFLPRLHPVSNPALNFLESHLKTFLSSVSVRGLGQLRGMEGGKAEFPLTS